MYTRASIMEPATNGEMAATITAPVKMDRQDSTDALTSEHFLFVLMIFSLFATVILCYNDTI